MLKNSLETDIDMPSFKLVIFPKPPFNFELLTALYAKWPTHFIESFSEGCYERTLEQGAESFHGRAKNNNLFFIRVSSEGSKEKPQLAIFILKARDVTHTGNISESEKRWIERSVRWMFSTDDDLSGFYELMSRFPEYSAIIEKLNGLRPPKTPTIFESAIIAISEQEIALKAAISIRKRLIEKYGKSFFIRGKKYYVFPDAEALSQANPEDIRMLGFTLRKGQYMTDIASRIVSGELDFESMKSWKTEEILKELGKLKGFGPWTIKYILQRGFGRFETVPFEDLGLRNGLTDLLGREEKISEKEARDFFEPFGDYKGYFAFYLLYDHLLHL